MQIFIPKETALHETRVAVSPDVVKKYIALGASVTIEAGAGVASGIANAEFVSAGAVIASNTAEALKTADIVLKVRAPDVVDLTNYKTGSLLIAILEPYDNAALIEALAKYHITALAVELLPRISRAQAMDVLSSQANLAGYRAVIDGAGEFGRALPMMMTAAGTVPAAKVFIMGVGVAGLQAIATARRLGAVVTATDVRPATKEQVASLGAKFIAVEDEEFKAAETAGGYAKQMSEAYQAKQAALVTEHIAKQDIVITTALIPGRPAPKLVSEDMVKSMRAGSVIVDLAAERGGNCALTKPGEVVVAHGVHIVGYTNVAGRMAATASNLYARNLYAFLETLVDKSSKALALNFSDELVSATCLTHEGKVKQEKFLAQTSVKENPGASKEQTEPTSSESPKKPATKKTTVNKTKSTTPPEASA